ncbi:MAG: hypothetical protein II336_01455 [Loktanella sp.]|nr:hypothetical protein [Loktanella sp.]
MTKTNGFVLAAFLMASTSPMAIGQTTDPVTEPVPTPGEETPMGTDSAPLPGDDAQDGTEPAPLPGDQAEPLPGDDATGIDMDGGTDDHSQIISDLRLGVAGMPDGDTQFSDMSSDAEVRIVTVSELEGTGDPMLDQLMADLEDDQDNLRSAIEDNETLTTALDDEGYSADDVVAAVVTAGAEAEVTLIVEDEDNGDELEFETDVDAEAEGEADL